MSFRVKTKEPVDTGTLYVRGVELELIEWVREEALRKGYSSTGEYLNQLLDLARQDSEEGFNEVGNKIR